MAARIPHTYRRNGTYYIRLKWPSHIYLTVPALGREFNHSLKTHDQQRARLLAYRCAHTFRQLVDFMDTCRNFGRMDQIDHESIVATLKATTSNTAKDKLPMSEQTELDPSNRIEIVDNPKTGERTFRSDLPNPDENMVEVISFIQKSEIRLGGGSGGPIDTCSGPTVEEVAERLAEELRVLGDWGLDKTHQQGTTRLAEIVKLLGPKKAFKSLKRRDVMEVRRSLMERVDPDRTRRAPRNGMMSLDTARSYFQLCTRLFQFALNEDIIALNPASNLSIMVRKKNKNKSSYRPFTKEDLNKLINGYIYRNTELTRSRTLLDGLFWAPLLAMYTGGRVNEICQLCIKDVLSTPSSKAGEPDIWYISINDDEVTQSTKTESSIRDVPLHDDLITLGFVDFFQKRKSVAGLNEQLFEKMPYCKTNGWGRPVSRWFNGETGLEGYLDSVQLTIRERKTFHSFRHTAAHFLRKAGTDEAAIAATVGHEHKTTTSIYGDGFELETLKDTINRLNYGLDLSHISYAAFQDYKACKGRPTKNKHLLYVSTKR